MTSQVLGKNWFACCVHCACQAGRQTGHPDKCDKGCDDLTGGSRVR